MRDSSSSTRKKKEKTFIWVVLNMYMCKLFYFVDIKSLGFCNSNEVGKLHCFILVRGKKLYLIKMY